jgi:predicted phage terminase large subunit-like protein
MFQQRPVNPGGVLFKKDCFGFYDVLPADAQLFMSWDLRFGKSQAKTSSFVVGDLWARCGAKFYLVAQVRDRWSYAESKNQVIAMAKRYPTAAPILVEQKAAGEPLEADLEYTVPGIQLYLPRGDKYQRAERVVPYVNAGDIMLPREPWVAEWLEEICAFPKGADDDRVDTFSQAISYWLDQDESIMEIMELY